VLLDSINWISHPKISPDGKWIAFADHENPGGDDEGSLAVIGPMARKKKGNFLPAGPHCRGFSGLQRAMRSGLPRPTQAKPRTRAR
jgi:Tol biopolymer transport system component